MAINILALAGQAARGTPYQGAPIRLLQIAESDSPNTPEALHALLRMPNRSQALLLLRTAAMSLKPRTAWGAVSILGRETGVEGLEVLRQLYLQGLVTQEWARREMDQIAKYHRW